MPRTTKWLYQRLNQVSRFLRRSINEHSIGVKVRADVVDTVMMMHIIQPSSRNSTPDMPDTRVSGKNTPIMVSVDATTEIATSLVPWMAACFGSEPRSMWLVTFSSTTIASSTTLPMAMLRHESEIMFNDEPVAFR